MAQDFQNISKEVYGTIPGIPSLTAERYTVRAWRRIRDFRWWSFSYISDAQMWVPAAITTGAVSVTYGSTTVTPNGAAITALNAVALAQPPLASPVVGIGRQLRVGPLNSSSLAVTTGPNYNITAWNGSVLTIDRPYGEPSATNSPYTVLKVFYAPPGSPFTTYNADAGLIRYLAVVNRDNGYAIQGKRLYYTQAELNRIDAQRGAEGDLYILASYTRNSQGQAVVEAYPNPVNGGTYGVDYLTRWPDISDTQDLPQVPYELEDAVTHHALCSAGRWALANVGTKAELQATNWSQFCSMEQQEFKDSMIQCLKQDNEIFPQKAFLQTGTFDFPLGGQFLQSHDISSLIP